MPLDFPNNPSTNDTFSSGGNTWRYDGSVWQLNSRSGAAIPVSSTAPTSPNTGDAWVDADTGNLYVYYDGYWVSPGVLSTVPTGTASTITGTNAEGSSANFARADHNHSYGAGSIPQSALALGPTYETVLPSSPVNGQEIYYTANATDSVIWHLRYNSSRSRSGGTGAWEFLGGPPLWAFRGANSTRASTTFGSLADSALPQVTLPQTGDYEITFGGDMSSPASGGQSTILGPGPTGGSPSYSAGVYQNDANSWTVSLSRTVIQTDISGTWQLYFRSTHGATLYCSNRHMLFRPLRVW